MLSCCEKVKKEEIMMEGSEGQPIRDHPVLARLVEIKSLLDKLFVGLRNALRILQPTQDGLVKGGVTSLCPGVHFIHYELKGVRLQFLIDWNSDRGGISFPNNMQLFNVCSTKQTKQLDGNLPSELEELLNSNKGVEMVAKLGRENATLSSDSFTKDQGSYPSAETRETTVPNDTAESEKVEPLKDNENKAGKCKHQSDQVGVQSMAMLKVRADLEERLKQEGILSSRAPKPDKAQKRLKPVNGRLVTYDDFDDDAIDVVSGDDDLPKRDDIGERRRKHELRVLAGAGIKSEDDVGDEVDNWGLTWGMGMLTWGMVIQEIQKMNIINKLNNDELQNLPLKLRCIQGPQHSPHLLLKPLMDNAISLISPDSHHIFPAKFAADGEEQRADSQAQEGNQKSKEEVQGTTQEKVNRRKGQVQEIKKPTGPYGGEASGS
uniref:Uncharacterized protein n=1 Tax=Fagus sylvatica TaxID=28930 RepID=A0A2N9GZ85_FAGSY